MRPRPMRSMWRCSRTGSRGGHGTGERRARALWRRGAVLRAGGIVSVVVVSTPSARPLPPRGALVADADLHAPVRDDLAAHRPAVDVARGKLRGDQEHAVVDPGGAGAARLAAA